MSSISKDKKLVELLLAWFSQNARDLPWRKTRDPYAIWISEIMLQQTQVKTVIPFWERWMCELPTVESLANAAPEKFLKLWEGLGYYTRARNLQNAAKLICEKYDGKFPENFDAILDLPGIGRYTAGAICSIAFNQPTPILDGNVIRVLTRVYGIDGNPRNKITNAQLWKLAEELVVHASQMAQPESCSHFNQSLMELGALVCTPRQAKCSVCPLNKWCVAFCEQRVEELPNLAQRAQATKRKVIAFVVECKGRFLVRQRPSNVVNGDLWEFPNFEVNGDKSILREQPFEILKDAVPLCVIKHSITRYRITLEAFSAKLRSRKKIEFGKWLEISELQQLAFSSAHRQILERVEALTKRRDEAKAQRGY